MLTPFAGNVYTAQAMATDKTTAIRVRVPNEVADALAEDAKELGLPPGTVVRQMLEARYSVRQKAGKANSEPAKTDKLVRLPQ